MKKPWWGWLGLLASAGLVACDSSNTMCAMLCTHTAEVRLEPPYAAPGAYTLTLETDEFEVECTHSLPWENKGPDCQTVRGQMEEALFGLHAGSRADDLDSIMVPNRPSSIRVRIQDATRTVVDETVQPTYFGEDSSTNCSCEYGKATIETR